jgi:hypothetical protein
MSHAARGSGDQRDRGEARQHRQRFQHPQAARESQRRDRIAGEREQRSVGRVLKRPSEERKDRVGRGFGWKVGVRVKAMQRSHAPEGDVAEDVLGEQRRSEREHGVGARDPRRQCPTGQRARGAQHEQIASAHDQHQRLEAFAGQPEMQAGQRARKPARPAAAAGGNVATRRARRTRAQQQDRREHGEHAEQAEQAQHPRGEVHAVRAAAPRRGTLVRTGLWNGGRGLHAPIVTLLRPHASSWTASL